MPVSGHMIHALGEFKVLPTVKPIKAYWSSGCALPIPFAGHNATRDAYAHEVAQAAYHLVMR